MRRARSTLRSSTTARMRRPAWVRWALFRLPARPPMRSWPPVARVCVGHAVAGVEIVDVIGRVTRGERSLTHVVDGLHSIFGLADVERGVRVTVGALRGSESRAPAVRQKRLLEVVVPLELRHLLAG